MTRANEILRMRVFEFLQYGDSTSIIEFGRSTKILLVVATNIHETKDFRISQLDIQHSDFNFIFHSVELPMILFAMEKSLEK